MSQTRTRRAALGYKTLVYFGTLIVGGLVFIVFDRIIVPMRVQMSRYSQTQYSANGIEWVAYQAWDWWPLFLVLLALVMYVAAGARESRGIR